MDYSLLEFDALKFFLGVRLYRRGVSLPIFNFFNVNSQIFQRNRKFTSQIAWKQIFTTFLTLVLELIDVGILTTANYEEESFFS